MNNKKEFQLNIGLNNNPKSTSEIIAMLEAWFGTSGILSWAEVDGEYKGDTEHTIVAHISSHQLRPIVVRLVKHFCGEMTQDCIPIMWSDGYGVLVYNEQHVGEKYEFDAKFFIQINK
jgi:hypothetical protein